MHNFLIATGLVLDYYIFHVTSFNLYEDTTTEEGGNLRGKTNSKKYSFFKEYYSNCTVKGQTT